jgi:hypothetical protein
MTRFALDIIWLALARKGCIDLSHAREPGPMNPFPAR